MSLFVVFEGPDGGGKSTQIRRLAASLRARRLPVTVTHEPGGTSLGDTLRELILDPAAPPATPLSVTLLLSASRAQLVETVIRPALARGEIVLADRYTASTLAYQGAGQGLDAEMLRCLNEIATSGLQPDVVLYIDVPLAVGLERSAQRGPRDRLDDQTAAFQQRVRSAYDRLMAADAARWRRIDGRGEQDTVAIRIMEAIEPYLERMVSGR